MAKHSFFNELFGSIAKVSVAAIRASDSEEFPIARSIFGKLSFQLAKKFASENCGPYRQFYEFMAFAYPLLFESYSSSLLDLIVLFHTREEAGLSWLEFADETDGIYESSTALLECKYGWQGVLLTKTTPAGWIKQNRRADIYQIDEISSIQDNQFPKVSPRNPSQKEGRESPQTSVLDTKSKCLHNFLKERYNSVNFTYIYVGSCDLFEILRRSDFLRNATARVLIVSHWNDERYHQVSKYLLALGYVPWLPEFLDGHFVFISRYNGEANPDLVENAPSVHNSIPPIAEFGRRGVTARNSKAEPNKLELVGVHFPKTGGASLLLGLNEHYGDWLFEDYQHDPGNPLTNKERPPIVGAYTKAVYGHFRADRYLNYNPGFMFTFIRDPFDLLLSNYFYLRDNLGETTNPEVALFQRTRPTLIEFAKQSGLGYAAYFGNMDLSIFDFVGSYANYAEDLEVLGQLTGVKFPKSTRNQFTKTPERLNMEADVALRAKVKGLLRADYSLYEKMLRMAPCR